MNPFSGPSALFRRAIGMLPLLPFLVSAHPAERHRPKPAPPRSCLEAQGLEFGSVPVGTKAGLPLTISNRCAHPFSIRKAASGSPAFSVSLSGAIRVPAHGSASLPVSFSPADTGAAVAVLALYAGHPDERIRVRVSGRGTKPAPPSPYLAIAPQSVQLSMGPAETDTFRLSVTNHGTSPRAEILVDAVGDPAPRPERGWRVLYLNTYMDANWEDDFTRMLKSEPGIDTLEAWYGGDSLPTLSRMLEYDVVMVVTSKSWVDSVAAGNLLADYLEAGGKVLLTAGDLGQGQPSLAGRIFDYSPVSKAPWTFTRPVANLVSHPITEGVAAFQSAAILQVTSTRGQGAGIPLGTYQDGILVGAYHPDKPLVFLNIADYSFSGDIPRLLMNAIDYLGGMHAWMTPKPPFDPVIFVVPEGETRELKVAVNSYRLGAGTHAGAIRLWNVSDTDAVPVEVPVSLNVASRRRLAVDPASLDFGPTWQGSTAKRAVRLVNTGNAPTRVNGFVSDGAAFSLNATLPLDIPAFSYACVPAAFAPASLGDDSAFVVAQSDAQEDAPAGIALRGKGIVAPILSVSPTGFSVTLTAGQQADRNLTIRNPGGDSLKLALRAVVDSAAGVYPTGPEKMKVLYLNTTGQTFDSPSDFFLWDMLTDPRIDSLVSWSGFDSTPTVAYMRQFDAVIAVAEGAWADSETVGNRLADYVDQGGKVILMGTALFPQAGYNPHSPALGGRIVLPGYAPVDAAGPVAPNYAQEFGDDPILAGINFNLYSWWGMNVTAAREGSVGFGRYSTGALIGAYNTRKPVIYVNILPHDGDFDHYQTVRLLGNALQQLSEFYNWLQPSQRTLTLGPGEEIDLPIRFGAAYGPAAGTYNGRLDLFHNDPSTASPLTVPATLTVEPGGETASLPIP